MAASAQWDGQEMWERKLAWHTHQSIWHAWWVLRRAVACRYTVRWRVSRRSRQCTATQTDWADDCSTMKQAQPFSYTHKLWPESTTDQDILSIWNLEITFFFFWCIDIKPNLWLVTPQFYWYQPFYNSHVSLCKENVSHFCVHFIIILPPLQKEQTKLYMTVTYPYILCTWLYIPCTGSYIPRQAATPTTLGLAGCPAQLWKSRGKNDFKYKKLG